MTVLLLTTALGGLILGFAVWGRWRRRRLLATIEVVTLPDVVATELGNRRDILVYLPPGYLEHANACYEVLYLNDGQEHEALGLHETLARLTAARRIRPILVVAIPTNDNRLHEYGTAVAPNRQGLGSLAAPYTRYVINELMPRIESEFRVCPGATISGVSLGGLSAFDIAWNHPERFAAVGVMSGSFWWRAAEDETQIDAGKRIAHALVRRATQSPPFRLWFQVGTRDEVSDRDDDGVIDAIQDTLELMAELRAIGGADADLAYVEVRGGRHDYPTWARVLPEFLIWAFGTGRN